MKHLKSKTTLLLMLLASATSLLARPQLHDIDIRVVLSKNGDARITEVRQMTIDSEGTECYIGLGNMGGSQIVDLQVSDETGTAYTHTAATFELLKKQSMN